MMSEKKRAVIIGCGPAGLTAAYELLTESREYEVVLLEESSELGGIAKTVACRGNRMDMGGHRFFSKSPWVNAWWEKMLPMQGAPAHDDILLGREVELAENGPDPERQDEVMLSRSRVSRIYFDGKFYDYPISLKPETFRNMGLVNTVKCGFSYLNARLHRLPEDSLENFYINSFGRKLYEMFFEYYTENLWGRHPSEIDASWGAQRTKGLSVAGIIKDVFGKLFHMKNRTVNTSLIESFRYPKYGPGQMWETAAKRITGLGGTIIMEAKVTGIHKTGGKIDRVIYEKNSKQEDLRGDVFLSSMPVKDLVAGMNEVPKEEARIAEGLPYRDYVTVGVLVHRLAIKNRTDRKTVGNIVPDCWVYVQDRSVKLGRFQIYNNWSPYMVRDPEDTVWIGLEYFCNEGDGIWIKTEDEMSEFAVSEMQKIGLIDAAEEVLDSHVERVKKAYPAYFDTYAEMEKLRAWLDGIENLYCIGRNGQHRYNNMDHSMLTAYEAVRCILSGSPDHSAVWNVNTEREYHEENRDAAAE